jgi:hypothetical protein
MVKTATLALLGLGNVFLGVNAAPTAVTEVQDRSVTYENNKLAVRAKAVPNLEASPYNYIVAAGPALPKRPILYTVTKKGVTGNIDEIAVNKAENSVTVEDANNGDEPKGDSKLSLSDIEISLFVNKGGKQATDLAIVRFSNVVEKSTRPVIDDAFAKLTPTNGVITVTSTSTGEAKTIFDNLQKAAFGKSVAKLHANYNVGQVTKYEITGSKTIPNLAAYVK